MLLHTIMGQMIINYFMLPSILQIVLFVANYSIELNIYAMVIEAEMVKRVKERITL